MKLALPASAASTVGCRPPRISKGGAMLDLGPDPAAIGGAFGVAGSEIERRERGCRGGDLAARRP